METAAEKTVAVFYEEDTIMHRYKSIDSYELLFTNTTL